MSCIYHNINLTRKNITVSFNLCANQDILSWGYKVNNGCDNKYGFYYWNADKSNPGQTIYGVENLYVPKYISTTKKCNSCSCDNVLFFPDINVCSTLSIVLLTQKHRENQEIQDKFFPNIQINPEIASKIPGITNCYIESSNRSKYQIWKAILCNPMYCNQKIEFKLIGNVETWDLFDTTMAWYNNENIFTDISRVENILLTYLD